MNSFPFVHAGLATTAVAAVPAGAALMRLDALGAIDAHGADALPFLHNQLTNDVEHLDASAARLGGLCSPKGRLLASFLYWRTADGVRLALSADLAEPIAKRLKMFVLRSKVTLTDVSGSVALLGIAGTPATLARTLPILFDALPDTVHGCTVSEAGTLVRLADVGGLARYLWSAPRDHVERSIAALDGALPVVDANLWHWLEVRAGEPRIAAATQDRFVPQMINFELLGGVSFRKGCYPGQEVVARSQYRGTTKRRTLLASWVADAADAAASADSSADTEVDVAALRAGTDVFDSAAPGEACGTIVNVARNPAGGIDCLVELRLAVLESAGTLHAGAPAGPPLALHDLPYPLSEAGLSEPAPATGL